MNGLAARAMSMRALNVDGGVSNKFDRWGRQA
jgi:hypothetical protein